MLDKRKNRTPRRWKRIVCLVRRSHRDVRTVTSVEPTSFGSGFLITGMHVECSTCGREGAQP